MASITNPIQNQPYTNYTPNELQQEANTEVQLIEETCNKEVKGFYEEVKEHLKNDLAEIKKTFFPMKEKLRISILSQQERKPMEEKSP